jgi:hypothetical protein
VAAHGESCGGAGTCREALSCSAVGGVLPLSSSIVVSMVDGGWSRLFAGGKLGKRDKRELVLMTMMMQRMKLTAARLAATAYAGSVL